MNESEMRAQLLAGQARLEGMIQTLTARVDAHISTNSEAIKALFAGRREHAEKIEDIRVDYVPKGELDEHRRQNRKDHALVVRDVSRVQWNVAKIAGGLVAAAAVVGVVLKSTGGSTP